MPLCVRYRAPLVLRFDVWIGGPVRLVLCVVCCGARLVQGVCGIDICAGIGRGKVHRGCVVYNAMRRDCRPVAGLSWVGVD